MARGAVVVALLLAGWAGAAHAVKRNFAGSAQLDYLLVPSRDRGRDITFDGFTTELSLKLSVDVTDQITASVKTCYGCHGFEMGQAFIDLRVADELAFRVGRFTPSFGDFPVRHDPANHRTSDKPLPYDMGRMLRLRDWNMSVLPAPYVDNGLEVRGTFYFGDTADLSYAAYVIGGLRAVSDATDVDFIQSRSGDFYYVDNNSRPTVGGRLALRLNIGSAAYLSLGGSAMWGTYDPDNELDNLILGADMVVGIDDWTLRAEYLLRRTEMSLGSAPEERFRYGPRDDGTFDRHFLKDGFYVSTDLAVTDWFELVARFDGLRRLGNVVRSSPLRSESMLLRYTVGANFRFGRAFRLKLSGEIYDFSDFEDEGAVHLGLVGTF